MEALRMDRDHDSSLLSGSTRTYGVASHNKKEGADLRSTSLSYLSKRVRKVHGYESLSICYT